MIYFKTGSLGAYLILDIPALTWPMKPLPEGGWSSVYDWNTDISLQWSYIKLCQFKSYIPGEFWTDTSSVKARHPSHTLEWCLSASSCEHRQKTEQTRSQILKYYLILGWKTKCWTQLRSIHDWNRGSSSLKALQKRQREGWNAWVGSSLLPRRTLESMLFCQI